MKSTIIKTCAIIMGIAVFTAPVLANDIGDEIDRDMWRAEQENAQVENEFRQMQMQRQLQDMQDESRYQFNQLRQRQR